MKKFAFLSLAFVITSFGFILQQQIKVACVGDSITEGYGLKCQSETAYPVILNTLLGAKYSVLNLGRSATTLQKHGDFPYWICKEFSDVFAFQPDIIVIQLGTNDTKTINWHPDQFEKDYQALIDTFKTIPTHPKIILCLPVPVFKTNWTINDSTLNNGALPIIINLAAKNRLPVIDLYHEMKNQRENFPDGIHPNESAAAVMAGIIAKELATVR